jgi:hydroxypyruvate reductase
MSAVVHKSPPLSEPEHFASITTHLLACNHTARLAAQHAAEQRGFSVALHDYDFQGRAELLGDEFARTILAEPAMLHIWGGEATVKLPQQPGRGGRCQHLALAAAMHLAGSRGLLLAAGTDGSDGPGEDAGALVDGGTVARGELEGLSARQALQDADAGNFLEASGDLIQTGPSGTNVMDLVLGFNPG